MKTLNEIIEIMSELDDAMVEEICYALNHYYDKGGALKLYNLSRKVGLTVDEIWEWENS